MTSHPDVDRLAAWLAEDLPRLAPPWLARQRWFGGKARQVERVETTDVLWLPAESAPCALVLLDVAYAPAAGAAVPHERYALVVSAADDSRGCPTISPAPWRPARSILEAATDASALWALLNGLLTGAPVEGRAGGRLIYADATSRTRHLLAPGPEGPARVHPIGLEQSNTSLRLGATHVFKLFRRLTDGENPQVEMGRFLAGTAFRAAPPIEGSVTYVAPDGRQATLGVMEGWVASLGDGWSYVVERLEQAARETSSPEGLAQDLFVLGTTTADFHATLASDDAQPAFAPEPVTADDLEVWRSAARAQAGETWMLIGRHLGEWPPALATLGREVLDLRPAFEERIRGLDLPARETVLKIRVHGDYHLGQTLKTEDGFVLIDFEGEPSKSLAERRRKQCALKDVAGMNRSFQYATETVRERQPGAPDPVASAALLRSAFMEGYQARALTGGARFVPADPDVRAAWVAFFELEKALYEVAYEINSRPAWVHLPLRGVVRLLRDASA